MDGWVNQLWYTHTAVCSSALKEMEFSHMPQHGGTLKTLCSVKQADDKRTILCNPTCMRSRSSQMYRDKVEGRLLGPGGGDGKWGVGV